MQFRNGAALAILGLLTSCGATYPVAPPPDPPQARTDAYSPFREPLNSQLVWAGLQVQREFGAAAKCTGLRFLSIPAAAADGVAAHYANALQPGWQPVALTPPPAMTVSAFRRGTNVFAAAVSRDRQDGIAGIVIVTNVGGGKAASDDRARCLAR